jgi:hypothetical protein
MARNGYLLLAKSFILRVAEFLRTTGSSLMFGESNPDQYCAKYQHR